MRLAVVCPPRGFPEHGPLDFPETAVENRTCPFRRERPPVEEVPVDVIREAQTVFRAGNEVLVELGRASAVVFAGDVAEEGAADVGVGEVDFPHVLDVPAVIAPAAVGVDLVAGRKPVLVRPVVVAHVEVDKQVVDEVVDIEDFFHGLVVRLL